MPPAVHRLSLFVLPSDADAPGERAEELARAFVDDGWLVPRDDGWAPGPRSLVAGGFVRARVERSATPRFVSNWQGGFRVACPVTGANVVPDFNRAFSAWRGGGPRELACPCGRRHDLAALGYEPEAGFARGWLVIEDVAEASIHPDASALAARILGGARVVGRRG